MTLFLLLATILPHSPPAIDDRVDRIELNHVQCPLTGRETLCQVIYWRWDAERSRYVVAAWRMADRPVARIRRDGRQWIESREDGPVRREIHAEQFRETWTFIDPEIEDRVNASPEMRRGLRPSMPR